MLLLPFAFLFLFVQGNPFRDRRQACECTAGEEPKCGCQVVPSSDPGKSFQMLCSCSPPTPPKCVCRETPMITPTPTLISVATSKVECVDVCKRSCLEPCNRLSSNGRCDQVCTEACTYSCAKQNKSTKDTIVGQYKFVLPPPTLLPPVPIPMPVPPPSPSPAAMVIVGNSITPAPILISPPALVPPKVCEPSCMPECNFACTIFKPSLKMITEVFERKVVNGEKCQQNCGETCIKVCSSTGISLSDCASNCASACTDTCGIVTKKICVPQCQPQCTAECIQIQTETQVPGAVIPQPAIMVTATQSPPPPAIAAKCQQECSVQCEHQCGVHTLAGPQCLAACQTTCYPVCQARLRKKHRRQDNQQY